MAPACTNSCSTATKGSKGSRHSHIWFEPEQAENSSRHSSLYRAIVTATDNPVSIGGLPYKIASSDQIGSGAAGVLLERVQRRLRRWREGEAKDAGDQEPEPYRQPLPDFVAPTGLPELPDNWQTRLILPNAPREVVLSLIDNLPPLQQVQHSWHLGYSTSTHGISLKTMYRCVSQVGPCILVVQDIDGNVFGAYASDGLRPYQDSYGTMETYLFRCLHGKESPDVYRPSAVSNFCDKKGIIVGLDGPALAVEEDILRGTSKPSATFSSPCLTESSFGAEYLIKKLEVWYWHTGFWD